MMIYISMTTFNTKVIAVRTLRNLLSASYLTLSTYMEVGDISMSKENYEIHSMLRVSSLQRTWHW